MGTYKISPVISPPLDLRIYLPHKVYVGFSASTGNYSQVNDVRSWQFSALDLDIEDHHQKLQWIWIIVAAAIALLFLVLEMEILCQGRR